MVGQYINLSKISIYEDFIFGISRKQNFTYTSLVSIAQSEVSSSKALHLVLQREFIWTLNLSNHQELMIEITTNVCFFQELKWIKKMILKK